MTPAPEEPPVRPGAAYHDSAHAFVEAVVLQLSRAEEAEGDADTFQTDGFAQLLAAVLHAVERGAEEDAVALLENAPLLISSVFQNADLLYQHGYPAADALGMATLTAIHRASEAEERADGQPG